MTKGDKAHGGSGITIIRLLLMVTIGVMVTLLGACAAPEPVRVSPQVEKSAKQMSPPAGKALVYIIREDQLAGSFSELVIEVNDRIIGSMYTGMFLVATLEPGACKVSASINPGHSPWIAFSHRPTTYLGKKQLITRIENAKRRGGSWFNQVEDDGGFVVAETKEDVDVILRTIFADKKQEFNPPIRILESRVKFPITFDAKAGETYFLRYTDRMSGKVWDLLSPKEGRKYIKNFHLSGQSKFTKYWIYRNNLGSYIDSLQK